LRSQLSSSVSTLSPNVGNFPNGVLTSYLVSNSRNLVKVSFVSGLVAIAVTPSAPSVPVGLTQQFKATGTFSDTSTVDLANTVQWTSSNQAAATIGPASGLASALAVGITTITATAGSVSGSATLTVAAAAVESISIQPNPAFAGVGIPTQLTATGKFSDGTTANVTNTASWTSSAPSVATVGPSTGQATGVALGSATISATIGSVTATTSLTVATGQWTTTSGLITWRMAHTATLLPNGKVLVVGGLGTSGGALASAELYDPIAGTWSPTGSLTAARAWHTATLLPNGMVLVAGGYNYQPPAGTINIASSEIYDPAAGTWSSTGSLAGARYNHTATLLPNGKVLVAGGLFYNGGQTVLASSELYDPVAGTWSSTGSLVNAVAFHTATLLQNGTVLAAAGMGSSSVGQFSQLYDPIAGTWSSSVGGTIQGTYYHTATLLPNGKVLMAGGFAANGALASCELYDPAAGTWSATGSLAISRYSHTATLLPNGKVLVASGAEASFQSGEFYLNSPVSSAELYDPTAGTWATTGSLLQGRDTFTATLLPDGAVVVAGGENGTEGGIELSPTVELYW
jgi:uncharacterized protein YjdB